MHQMHDSILLFLISFMSILNIALLRHTAHPTGPDGIIGAIAIAKERLSFFG